MTSQAVRHSFGVFQPMGRLDLDTFSVPPGRSAWFDAGCERALFAHMWIMNSLRVLDSNLVIADNNGLCSGWAVVADIHLAQMCSSSSSPSQPQTDVEPEIRSVWMHAKAQKLMQVPSKHSALTVRHPVCKILACCWHYNFAPPLHTYTQMQMNICRTPLTSSLPASAYSDATVGSYKTHTRNAHLWVGCVSIPVIYPWCTVQTFFSR